jgi:small multidrug resistance family-3 protein
MYSTVSTFQKSHFHRVYAAYGEIFIIMALVWGCFFEGTIPDAYDILGTAIVSFGIIIIFYYPRKEGERDGEKIGIGSSG